MKKIMICLSQLMLLLLLLGAKKVYAMDCYFLTINAIENNSSCKKNIEDVESVFRRNQLKGYSEKQKYFNYTYNCEGIGSTKSEFDAALDLAFSKSTTNDRIVLYYTGHGRMEQKSNNELRGTGLELGNDYYPYEDLAKKICSYKCKYAVIMLEACGSGAFIDEAKKMPQAKSKMVVFTASKAEEKARYRKKWFNDLPYSRFTNALTAGFKNPTFYADMIKKDGSVTAEELFSYIKVVMGQDLLNWKIKDEEVVSAWKDQTPMAYYGNKNFAVFQYTKLSLNKSSLPFKQIGTYSTLKAKITGVQDTVKWTSDNTSVATVNSKGVVIAKSAGAAKITATCNRAKAVCTVIVSKQTSPVKINKTSTTILAGSSVTLKATYNL